MSHKRILQSLEADNIKSPKGEKATEEILWSCPTNVLMHAKSFKQSQIFIEQSAEQLAINLPVGS